MAKTLDQQIQNIVFSVPLTANDAEQTTSVINNNNDLFIYGGDVRLFDEDGEITDTTRLDRFEVDIQANEKNSISNRTFDARSLRAMLQHDKFPGFILGKDAKTKLTVSHTYTGSAAVGDPPYEIRVTLFGKVLDGSTVQ